MENNSTLRKRPAGVMAWILRVPILFYRMGFASQLAKRDILLLKTRGRRSGAWRMVGLNFVRVEETIFVAAGWGESTLWYRNLIEDPEVEIQIGAQRMRGRARRVIDPAEIAKAETLLEKVEGGPPKAIRPLLRLLGFDYEKLKEASLARRERLVWVALEGPP